MLFVLLLATAMAHSTPADTSRVAVLPLEQTLELDLDPLATSWSGSLVTKLAFQGTTRELRLRLGRSVVSRIQLADARGSVPCAWGLTPEGELRIEASTPVQPGPGWLNVSFVGAWSERAPGMTRDPARALARLAGGAGLDYPAWPETPPTRWSLLVHAPARYEVRASGRRTEVDDGPVWRAWSFRTAHALAADSLRVTVRPAAPRAGRR